MGRVIAFPSTYEKSGYTPEAEEQPTLLQKVEHFAHLRRRQQHAEVAVLRSLPAQRKMNRLAAEMLEVRIDRAVQDLQQAPADHQEAQNNIQTLFALADSNPADTIVLEEAALYVTSAYWDGGHVATPEIAPLLRARAQAAEIRPETGGATIDMIHAVVTQHITGCCAADRLYRFQQLEQYGLLEYFDHSPDPDFPPAA